jgi:hypothetical protein
MAVPPNRHKVSPAGQLKLVVGVIVVILLGGHVLAGSSNSGTTAGATTSCEQRGQAQVRASQALAKKNGNPSADIAATSQRMLADVTPSCQADPTSF